MSGEKHAGCFTSALSPPGNFALSLHFPTLVSFLSQQFSPGPPPTLTSLWSYFLLFPPVDPGAIALLTKIKFLSLCDSHFPDSPSQSVQLLGCGLVFSDFESGSESLTARETGSYPVLCPPTHQPRALQKKYYREETWSPLVPGSNLQRWCIFTLLTCKSHESLEQSIKELSKPRGLFNLSPPPRSLAACAAGQLGCGAAAQLWV